MAISNLLPRKTMHNRTRLQSMAERHDYDQKPEKTRDGELVSAYMCSPETAAEEFEISKQLYHQLTGRSQPKKRDVIMYRIIQSFRPGEVTPEEANRIGYELAMRFPRRKNRPCLPSCGRTPAGRTGKFRRRRSIISAPSGWTPTKSPARSTANPRNPLVHSGKGMVQ